MGIWSSMFSQYSDVGNGFYQSAFSSSLNSVWGNFLSSEEVNQLAYYQSLVSFIEDNASSEKARRELLYYYVKPFMDTSDRATLTKARGTLPTSNLYIKQLLQASCQLYVNPPVRSLGGRNAERMADILDNSDINSTLNESHKVARFTSECLVFPYFLQTMVSGKPTVKLYFDILAPNSYYYVADPQAGVVLNILRPYVGAGGGIYDSHWLWYENGEVEVVDNSGKIIKSEMEKIQTKYNSPPFAHLELNVGVNGEPSSMWEILRAQLDYNKYSLLGDNNVTLNGFASPVLINLPLKPGDSFGAGKVMAVSGLKDSSGLYPPSVDYVDPPVNFSEIDDYKNTQIKNVLRAANMPNSLIDQSANLQSGIAMQIDRQALDEQRISDESRMKQFDRDLINKIADVYNAQVANEFDSFDIDIEYVETVYPSDATADYQLTRQKFIDGVISPRQYLRLTTDLDPTSSYLKSDEAALKYIQDNKAASSSIIDSNTNSQGVNNV